MISPAKEDFIIRTNFHTHTARCQHAAGTDEAYAISALQHGFSMLGFSDHTPWPFTDGFVSRTRMLPAHLEGYVHSIRALKEQYAGRVEITLGLEAEYNPAYMGWLDEIRGRYELDYLIFGNHYDKVDEAVYYGTITGPEYVRRYADKAISGLESGRFDCLAHPDLFLLNYPRFDTECRHVSHDICAAARDNGVPLEYNLSGFQHPARGACGLGYPFYEFWQIAAQEGASAVIGVDAHSPERLHETGLYDLAVDHLRALGIPRMISLAAQKAPAAFIA